MTYKTFFPFQIKELHPAGRFLYYAIILIPIARVLLYPYAEDTWQFYGFNGLIAFLQILFISIFILQRRVRNYALDHLPNILWLAFLIWASVALFNIPAMVDAETGKAITGQFFIHFFFFLSLGWYLKNQPQAGRYFIYALIVSALLFLPFFWIKLYLIYDTEEFNWAWQLPGFTNVRHLGYFLGSILTILGLLPLTRIFKDQAGILTKWLFIVLSAFWVMEFWSGSRGSALAAMASVGIILVLFRPENWRRLFLFNISALILAAMISLLLPVPNPSFGLFRFLAKITEMESFNVFTAGRLAIWIESIDVWLQHIWFGTGAGQTKTIIQSSSGVLAQPHNVIIQALMAWGIIGGLPFLAAFLGFFWTKGKALFQMPDQENIIPLISYGLALSIFINSLVDGTLYYPFPLFIFVIAVSIALSRNNKSKI